MRYLLSLLIIGCAFIAKAQPSLDNKNVFEFRGVWVATVVNIDWPSKPGLSNELQKKEFIDLLELHQKNGMNAIIMQVRPSGDALYPSTLEPWSEYLMGKQGLPPSPFYDPLSFMIPKHINVAWNFMHGLILTVRCLIPKNQVLLQII